jgi:serine/threonine protein kinase
MMNDLSRATEREERLNEVLLSYVEALQAGQELDRGWLLAQHSDLRDDLLSFFASHDEVERLAAPLRAATRQEDGQSATCDIGQLGDFRLLRVIGQGGMGVVYEAEQFSLRRRVALKVLPFAAAIDPRHLQRFKNEALAAAHLRHENIVPVYAVGCERGVHYYAMQFIEGQSLAALISELRRSPERSTGSRHYHWVAGLGRQAALALEYAHQTGIVHRDVKPGNLLLDVQGQLWVADFGLAQVSGDTGLTMTGEMLGTLRYASPEQALGRRGVADHRSDVYSLGATLYELLTLRHLFEGCGRNELLRQIADAEPSPPRSIVPSIPLELETIILKALRKEPADRYATARDLADDLERFQDNRPILARRPTLLEHLRKWTLRHPAVVAAAVAALLLLTAGSLLSTALIRGEQARTRAEQHKAEAAYHRERQRAEEAETRWRLARRSVDELIQVSEEELADRPGMEGLRTRLLSSALAYYQEFIEQRRDDPDAQAELRDTKRRVEKILADLAVLRAAGQLYLLCQDSVQADLQLSDKQRARVKELSVRAGKWWMESMKTLGVLSPAERSQRALAQARANEAEINAILSLAHQKRLRQIGLQARGPGAFREPEVVAALRLTPRQRQRIRIIEDEALFSWMRTTDPREKRPEQRILAELTPEQTRQWREMTGEPVQGSVVPFTPFAAPRGPKESSR